MRKKTYVRPRTSVVIAEPARMMAGSTGKDGSEQFQGNNRSNMQYQPEELW